MLYNIAKVSFLCRNPFKGLWKELTQSKLQLLEKPGSDNN